MTIVRARTLQLLDACCATERPYFGAYCEVAERRKKPTPPAIAKCDRLWQRYHEAVLELREHVDGDPRLAAAERLELARAYLFAEQDLERELARARGRGAKVLTAIRERYANMRMLNLDLGEEIWHGLGWPHRGEVVIVTTDYYTDGPRPETRIYEGDAFYECSHSTMNTSHLLNAPGNANRGRLIVSWQPDNWGPADPAGDIQMRLKADPKRRLPTPFPRFPTADWLGAEQMQLSIFDEAAA